MTYSTLDTIPYKTFLNIAKTGDLTLLSTTETDPEALLKIWDDLYEQHLNRENATSQEKKTFRISKEVDSLEIQYKITLMACDALKFDFSEELHLLLTKEYGFKLRLDDEEVYYQDIDRIEREAKSFNVKAGVLKKHLPKKEEGQEYSIDDIMASYGSILGYPITGDFNQITYTAFFSYEKQVHAKIDAIKKQELKSKKNG
ncbi:hypothetical protein [Flavobacterium sp. 1355]|jgi:hypothetical protein|uniref:hypothetical protein n=1 Tax=Flavobacterium sp. 1355 TaxID=2806571 RepID=UPI001AE32A03|nr:hypothetical protein [Flavobacterium sp. 1355]MBP1222663.1 hypothetical protein [Flavobacterium sp. 1355]